VHFQTDVAKICLREVMPINAERTIRMKNIIIMMMEPDYNSRQQEKQ